MGRIKQWLRDSALVCAFVREPTEHEMFVGAEKPSITLAKMIVLEMMQMVRDVQAGRVENDGVYFRNKQKFTFKTYEVTTYTSGVPAERKIYSRAFLPDRGFAFDAEDQKILDAGFLRFHELWTEWKANEKEFARQQKAVDLIANHLKVEANGNVHEGVRSADSSGQAQSIITTAAGS